jgi:hypothetical protein
MTEPIPSEIQKEEARQLRLQLQKLILPIVATQLDGTVSCVGTGFLIVANGRHAHMVTAAHVVDHLRKIENPYSRHHPSTPEFFRPQVFRFELRRTIPRAMYYDGETGRKAVIEACLDMPKTDLALCRIRFEDDVPEDIQFQTRFGIDTSPVKVGDRIIAIGYSEMNTSAIRQGDNSELIFGANWECPIGKVTAVCPGRGRTDNEYHTFFLDIPLKPGMSGGPVMTEGEDGPHVRGVVRSDLTDQMVADDAAPTALAAMLWPIMLAPLTPPDRDGTITEGKTLLDLQREGVIIDRGNASAHVRCTRGENGQVTGAHWQP